MPFPEHMESGNLQIAMNAMGQEATAASGNRIRRSDQLSGDSQAMWAIHMTTPTNLAANALRLMNESGSGRAREGVTIEPKVG